MNTELIYIRIKSFVFELVTVLLTAIVGVLSSSEVSALVTQHWGEGLVGTLVLLVLSGAAKHISNIRLAKKLGASGERPVFI